MEKGERGWSQFDSLPPRKTTLKKPSLIKVKDKQLSPLYYDISYFPQGS